MSIQDLEKIRRGKRVELSRVLELLEISNNEYIRCIKGMKVLPQEKLFLYMEFLGVREMDIGAQELALFDGILKASGAPRTAFYRKYGKDVTYVLNQIRNSRSVSFDQLVRYYAGIGYKFFLLDNMDMPVRKIVCSELVEYEKNLENGGK